MLNEKDYAEFEYIKIATALAVIDISEANYVVIGTAGGFVPHNIPNNLPLKYFFGQSGCMSRDHATKYDGIFADAYNRVMLDYIEENSIAIPTTHVNRFDEVKALNSPLHAVEILKDKLYR